MVPLRALFVRFSRRVRSRRYLRPCFGQWCSRTSTMSLSRSEEMHRLTENVYKVSYPPHAPSRPPGAVPGPSVVLPALPRGPSASPAEIGSGPLAPTASRFPRAPFSASACAAAGAFGSELSRGADADCGVRGLRGSGAAAARRPAPRGGPAGHGYASLGHFFLNRLSLSTTPSRWMWPGGRSRAGRFDG